MSYSTACCSPFLMRFSDMVLRSLAAKIESMIVVKDASSPGVTVDMVSDSYYGQDVQT